MYFGSCSSYSEKKKTLETHDCYLHRRRRLSRYLSFKKTIASISFGSFAGRLWVSSALLFGISVRIWYVTYDRKHRQRAFHFSGVSVFYYHMLLLLRNVTCYIRSINYTDTSNTRSLIHLQKYNRIVHFSICIKAKYMKK